MVNVIIVTYNGMQWIERCLGSLENQSLISKIIVVDNGSTDGTIDYIQKQFPRVHLIINEENKGFGYANNQGLQISLADGCEYAFLLNQDAWIKEDTMSNLIHVHKKHPGFGILSPMHIRGDEVALDMKFATFVAQSENHKLFSDLYLNKDNLDPVYDVQFVNAAAWLIPRACIEKVGGFAPIYHHYGEDMDYGNRILYHGFKIGICPSAQIVHDRKNVIELPDINNPDRYLKIKKIWHLIYLTDIRHSFIYRFLKLLTIVCGHCLTSFFYFRLRNAWIYLKELIILIGIWPNIISNNSKTKNRRPNFLFLN